MVIDLDKINWQFQATYTIPVLGLIASFVIYYLQKQKKALGYSILEIKQHSIEEIDGKQKPVVEVKIEYKNVANIPLIQSDFITGIKTNFLGATIISAEIPRLFIPNHVEATLSYLGDTSVIVPSLLNQGEHIVAVYRIMDFNKKIDIGGRIVGVPTITNQKVQDLILQRLFLLLIVYYFIIVGLVRTTHVIDVKILLAALIVNSLAYVGLSIWHIWQEIKAQCLHYFIWELQ